MNSPSQTYDRYRRALRDERLPAALVDLDALDRNIDSVVAWVRRSGKKLRIASKSIRCVELLRHIERRAAPVAGGVMAYAVAEAALLVEHGFDDVLVAYPSVQPADTERLAALNKGGATVSIVVDSPEHLEPLEQAAALRDTSIPVVVEVDLSWRMANGRLHLGVRRSPLHRAAEVADLAERVRRHPHLSFLGVMGYEAQIAGLTDANPFSPWKNAPKRLLKRLSRPHVEALRREVAEALAARGIQLPLFNGGGTGSLLWCTGEAPLTEVTAGSGFLDGHLFDYYRDFALEPALCFALQVVRRPAPGIVTCHGGGYVASGEAGPDRLPRPHLPEGLRLLDLEGAGEVQTPVVLPAGLEVAIGDPIFFRHAKSGELAEHFERYALVRGDEVQALAPTYRGMGACFL
jgi:D-serine deaminase-like pyridoxal phosphate-dependent protein